MNFLLHRHLGARDLGTRAAGVGAMLPDLWRMADRRVRPQHPSASVAPPHGELLAGVQHHLEADRWFHANAVFVDGEREATHRLREAKISASRTVLFAHVLWELCLDGALVMHVGLDRVLYEVREGMNETRGSLSYIADLHHFSRVARTTDERSAFESRLDRICVELTRGPWIDGYQSGQGIAARVQGVRTQVGLAPMGVDDEARFAEVARELLRRAETDVDLVLAAPCFADGRV